MGRNFSEITMEKEPWLRKGNRSRNRGDSGPDGRQAWCVAFAACFINFVMAGLARMSGILYVAIIDIFHTDRMQASIPFSARSSTRNLLGPVVGILGQKYGVRPVTIVGGILGTVSAASCFFVNDIKWLTILWGVFNGIGTALATMLPQVTIGQHFKKHRSTASGMSFSGGCFGSFLFPVLLENLLYTYHLGGTFLIIAGIIMHVIPAAMILREPSWLKEKKPRILISEAINKDPNAGEVRISITEAKIPESDINVNDVTLNNDVSFPCVKYASGTEATCICQCSTSRLLINYREIDRDILWENRKLVIRLLTNDFALSPPSDVDKLWLFNNNDSIVEIKELFLKIVADVQNDSVKSNGKSNGKNQNPINRIFINGSSKSQLTNSVVTNSHPISCLSFYLEYLFGRERSEIVHSFSEGEDEHVYKVLDELWNILIILNTNKSKAFLNSHSTTSLFLDSESINFDDNIERPNTFSSHIKTTLKLHTKPLFLMICLCRSVHFMTFVPIVTTIVDFSIDKGLRTEDGKYVIAALSSGDLMGRLCFGWITDKGYISLSRFMLFGMIIQGASTACLSFMNSAASLMSAIAVFGLLQGCIFVRHPVLISRYLGSHEQSIAMGCINFFSGILGFFLPSYIGYFRDTMGSYNGIFYINGAVAAFIGLLWVFEPYFVRLAKADMERNQPIDV